MLLDKLLSEVATFKHPATASHLISTNGLFLLIHGSNKNLSEVSCVNCDFH
jgi:hypothetical protein